MAIPSWPSGLSFAPLISGYDESDVVNLRKFEPEIGPAKTRRASSFAMENFSLSIVLNTADLATLDDFYRDTLKDGALSFTHVHPRLGATATLRFVEPFKKSWFAHDLWQIGMTLRKLY